ncbi:MAG TPA: hypothetical protein VH234_01925 [Candidatus Saccharimonadales bacterium]|nr:hypothetical protein [Candidatus Saccharimonadales bacterium]
MDFSNRNVQPQPAVAPGAVAPVNRKSHSRDDGKWGRIGVVVAAVCVFVLLAGAIVVLASGNNGDNEGKYVDTGKLQAVFLNTGQVYFGNVKALNSKYFVLTNIYYLQTSSGSSSSSTTTAANNVSLVKLGCELHEPYDQMVINRSQVTFWENLQDGGQVATAVKKFQQANPQGQKCSDQSSSASTTSGNSAQSAGSSSTPAASTGTTKP